MELKCWYVLGKGLCIPPRLPWDIPREIYPKYSLYFSRPKYFLFQFKTIHQGGVKHIVNVRTASAPGKWDEEGDGDGTETALAYYIAVS